MTDKDIENSKLFLSLNKEPNEEGKEIVCVWDMGSGCRGDVNKRLMFHGQLEIPVCDGHYLDHAKLMAVNDSSEHGIDNLVQADNWTRLEAFKQEFNSTAITPSSCRGIVKKVTVEKYNYFRTKLNWDIIKKQAKHNKKLKDKGAEAAQVAEDILKKSVSDVSNDEIIEALDKSEQKILSELSKKSDTDIMKYMVKKVV